MKVFDFHSMDGHAARPGSDFLDAVPADVCTGN